MLKDDVALVTGAGGGIGQGFVAALLAGGARRIYACGTRLETLAPLASAHPGQVIALRLDITDPASVAAAAAQCADVSLLVNNAGVNANQSFLAPDSLDVARREMEVNYLGTLSMARAFAPVLAANGGGAMVNISSIVALATLPVMASYAASKAAVLRLTEGLRAELAAQGTRVVAVLPGAVDTILTRDYHGPKMAVDVVVAEILDAMASGADTILVGDEARGFAQALHDAPEALMAQLATMLPQAG